MAEAITVTFAKQVSQFTVKKHNPKSARKTFYFNPIVSNLVIECQDSVDFSYTLRSSDFSELLQKGLINVTEMKNAVNRLNPHK